MGQWLDNTFAVCTVHHTTNPNRAVSESQQQKYSFISEKKRKKTIYSMIAVNSHK